MEDQSMIFNLLSAYMSFDIFSVYSFICFILPGSVWLFLNRQKIAHKRYRQRHIIWIYIYMLYCYLAVKKVAGILTMNTLGTAVGFGCWIAFRCLFPKAGRKAIKVSSAEPLVYLFGGILGIILLYNWRIFG